MEYFENQAYKTLLKWKGPIPMVFYCGSVFLGFSTIFLLIRYKLIPDLLILLEDEVPKDLLVLFEQSFDKITIVMGLSCFSILSLSIILYRVLVNVSELLDVLERNNISSQ